MGQIRSFIQSNTDNDDKIAAQNAVLETLSSLAQEKGKTMTTNITTKLRTAGTTENETVPIESILATTQHYHAYTTDSLNENLTGSITKALKGFCAGGADNVINGISSMISESLSVFLQDSCATEDYIEEYYLLTEGMSIIRIDLASWRRDVKVKGMENSCRSVSAFAVIKSAVDLSKIHLNTFLYMYEKQLEPVFEKDQAPFAEQIEKVKQIYGKFIESFRESALTE